VRKLPDLHERPSSPQRPSADVAPRIARYGVAVLAVTFAAAANALLWPDFGLRYPLIAFYPAITVSAWFGGFWPGVAGTALSSIIAAFVWLDPRFSAGITRTADAVALSVFFGVGIVISVLSESLVRKGRRERAARYQAEGAEERLEAELADMRRLQALNTTVLQEDELPGALQAVLQASIELLNADGGQIHLHDEATGVLTSVVHAGLSEEFVESLRIVRAGDFVTGEALAQRTRIIVQDAARDPAFAYMASWYASCGFVAVQSSPLLDRDGKPLAVLSTYFRRPCAPANRALRFLDLYLHQAGRAIEIHRLLDAERSARQEAETANRLKDHFLSTVSHELRTPLNAILGWTDMLRSGRLAAARRERALQAVYDNAQRQVQLVGDLLDVSRIVSGKLRLDRTMVDLRAVVNGALDVIEPAAQAKAIRVVVDHDPNAITAYGDSERLQQVAWNLLSNAVKFTPSGGTIHVGVRRCESFVELVVRDTGTGIPRDFLPYVFEPFRQADGSTTRLHGGLGLGLSIVRHLVEAHGGSVHAASDGVGKGATFTVRLASPPVPPTSLLQGLSVLVVDDDADSREVVLAALKEAGAFVIMSTSAADALDRLQRDKVDLLLADVAMAGEDGYSLMRKVRALASSEVSSIPAIALTSLSRARDRWETANAGFQLHVPKPIDAQTLAHVGATLMNRTGAMAAVPTDAVLPSS
jgi:signal transduction histidine kinase/ActR/RegA family two-component response regulator